MSIPPSESVAEPPSADIARLPLRRFHRRLGGQLGSIEGVEVVAGYGRDEEELRALTNGVALVDRSWIGRREILGADRQRFLHGLVTCDVKALTPGGGAYGFVPSPQGKVLADVLVLALEDRLWLELPMGMGRAIGDHFKKYLLADRVELLPLADMLPLSLVGPKTAQVLSGETSLPVAPWSHFRAEIAGVEVELVRGRLAGQPAFTLWVSASVAEPLLEALLARGGIVPAGRDAFERARVLAGLPAFGTDFGPEHFPQETGLESWAVSYTKGCYLGQEVIARIHYRGKAQRQARRLAFAEGDAPHLGARLTLRDEEVGRVTSLAVSAGGGPAVGIAVLHRKGYETGTRLEVEGGGDAEVLALPTPRLE